ncbi:MAG: hypothetical protein AB8B59_03290 [Maribacter sp.]
MKRIKNYLVVICLSLSFINISCETEIPDTDIEPPTFLFEISGDGFSETFDQNTDFESFQLNLREDALYTITFSGADLGGMKQIQWQYDTDYVEFETSIPSPWTMSSSGLSTSINWTGSESNPTTGMVLTARFRANGENIGHTFHFLLKDFGGVSSMENTTFRSLSIYSGNHITELIDL